MLKLKSLITEQEFKAKSKETGRTVVYKSKDSMDKAIKGGKAEPLDKKTGGKPEKVKGADLFTKDKPKSEPKKVPDRSGPGGMQGTKNQLVKGLQSGLNPYQHSGLVKQVLDFVGDYPELTDRIDKLDPPSSIDKSGDYKPDAEYQKELDAFREEENELRDDIIKALSGKDVEVGTKIKDGKIKSSGSQQFADDVKNMKGEFDLGGAKIKDGKMFDADGNQMDSDEIEDFYYQDAFDEKGNNVGIDVKDEPKDEPKKAKRKSVQLDFALAKNQAELERIVKKAGLDVKGVDVDINPNGDLTAKVTGDEETLRKFMTSDEYGMDPEDVDDYMDEYGEDAEDDESETESKPYSARDEIDDAIDQDESEAAMELIQSEVGFKNMGKDGKEAKKLLDRLADAEYALIDLSDEEKDEIKDRLKQITKKHIKESKISKLAELSKITTRYNK